MRYFRTAIILLLGLVFAGAGLPASAGAASVSHVDWRLLEPGLELARVQLTLTMPSPFSGPAPTVTLPKTAGETKKTDKAPGTGGPPESAPSGETPETPPVAATILPVTASALRIDPARYTFALYMASEKGRKPLAEICKDEQFAAAINAGMFLPDRLTNTGYLRHSDHTNNGRVAANFGSFFVAGPTDASPPHARLLDRHVHDWQTALTRYSLIMQNYRMTTASGRVIWKQADRLHSVAALGQDAHGNILFIFCPDPVPASDFMKTFLPLIGALSVMYLEGGSEAALALNAGGLEEVRTGRHISGLWSGGANLEIPNVLGVRRKGK